MQGRIRRVLALGALFGGLALVAGGLALFKRRALAAADAQAGAYEPAEAVEVVAAREAAWTPMADLVGTVFSRRAVQLSNEVPGRVRAVHVASGQVVEEGAVVLELDDAVVRAEEGAAAAQVEVAAAAVGAGEARLRLAEVSLRRLERLARDVTTELDLDRARAELEQAKADRARLEAEVRLARARAAEVAARRAQRTVRAPFRARAGILGAHEGQFLPEGTAFLRLEELTDRVFLDFAIPQDHADKARPGLVIQGECPLLGPGPTPIEVVAVDAAVADATRNLRVRAEVRDPDGRLRAGMFVPIRVPIDAPRTHVFVPATAVLRQPHADAVFVVAPEAPAGGGAAAGGAAGGAAGEGAPLRARTRFVRLGPATDDGVIVLEGLAAGEQVAATGAFKLRDGALVRPVAPAGAGAPAGAPEGPAGDAPGGR